MLNYIFIKPEKLKLNINGLYEREVIESIINPSLSEKEILEKLQVIGCDATIKKNENELIINIKSPEKILHKNSEDNPFNLQSNLIKQLISNRFYNTLNNGFFGIMNDQNLNDLVTSYFFSSGRKLKYFLLPHIGYRYKIILKELKIPIDDIFFVNSDGEKFHSNYLLDNNIHLKKRNIFTNIANYLLEIKDFFYKTDNLDLKSIKQALRDDGFLDARVFKRIILYQRDKFGLIKSAKVVYFVHKGDQYNLGNIRVLGHNIDQLKKNQVSKYLKDNFTDYSSYFSSKQKVGEFISHLDVHCTGINKITKPDLSFDMDIFIEKGSSPFKIKSIFFPHAPIEINQLYHLASLFNLHIGGNFSVQNYKKFYMILRKIFNENIDLDRHPGQQNELELTFDFTKAKEGNLMKESLDINFWGNDKRIGYWKWQKFFIRNTISSISFMPLVGMNTINIKINNFSSCSDKIKIPLKFQSILFAKDLLFSFDFNFNLKLLKIFKPRSFRTKDFVPDVKFNIEKGYFNDINNFSISNNIYSFEEKNSKSKNEIKDINCLSIGYTKDYTIDTNKIKASKVFFDISGSSNGFEKYLYTQKENVNFIKAQTYYSFVKKYRKYIHYFNTDFSLIIGTKIKEILLQNFVSSLLTPTKRFRHKELDPSQINCGFRYIFTREVFNSLNMVGQHGLKIQIGPFISGSFFFPNIPLLSIGLCFMLTIMEQFFLMLAIGFYFIDKNNFGFQINLHANQHRAMISHD